MAVCQKCIGFVGGGPLGVCQGPLGAVCPKEKQSWFSVVCIIGGFGMETSNFALNGCLRVSIVSFFDARSNGRVHLSLCAVYIPYFNEKRVF